jgi:molybdenum cofactor synthesis domain-containing protein
MSGQGFNPPGSDAREGELLLSHGLLLTPTRLAILAAFGLAAVLVGRKPMVALLATGDELRELGEDLPKGPWTVCNNRYLLGWLTASAGGVPIHLGIAKDDPAEIAKKMGVPEADVVISTGGTGRGDRDFLLEAWQQLGVRPIFTKIRLAPGKHTALGVRGRQIYFGLSGNPWAARAVFQELIAPVIRKLQGQLEPSDVTIPAILESPVLNRGGLGRIVSGRLIMSGFQPVFAPDTDRRGTSNFRAVTGRFAYILLNSHVVEIPDGSVVRVRLHDLPSIASVSINGPESHDGGKDCVASSP